MPPIVIEIAHLTKRFRPARGYRELLLHPFRRDELTALQDVSLEVRQGELFGLLGPNGAGKTTLIKLLSTLLLPSSGRAVVNGFDVVRQGAQVRRSIGYVVSDERSFYWRLSGRQNLLFFATLNNLSRAAAQERTRAVLELVELEEQADRPFMTYSTGMRQRLAIARAFLTEPQVLFMDEPTRSLDPGNAHHLRTFIAEEIVARQGRTVLLATHNLAEVEALCGRIAIIDHGRIRACGSLPEIRQTLAGSQRYVLRLEAPSEPLLAELRGWSPVCALSEPDGRLDGGSGPCWDVRVSGDADEAQAVLCRAVEAGVRVAAWYPEETSLQEVFARCTAPEGPA